MQREACKHVCVLLHDLCRKYMLLCATHFVSLCVSVSGHPWEVPAHSSCPEHEHWWQEEDRLRHHCHQGELLPETVPLVTTVFHHHISCAVFFVIVAVLLTLCLFSGCWQTLRSCCPEESRHRPEQEGRRADWGGGEDCSRALNENGELWCFCVVRRFCHWSFSGGSESVQQVSRVLICEAFGGSALCRPVSEAIEIFQSSSEQRLVLLHEGKETALCSVTNGTHKSEE